MIAPGNSLIQVLFAVAFVIASGYAFGRIHQWYRDGAERDEAYRRGYDRASDHLLDMALSKQPADTGERHQPHGTGGRPTVVLVPRAPEGTHRKHAVGHSRRRMVATQLDYAARGTAAH